LGIRPGSQRDRVLAVIEEGPATTPEVAAETGLSIKHCCAHLRALWEIGLLERKPGHRTRQGGRRPFIYSLKGGYPCKPTTTTPSTLRSATGSPASG
jgi:predicted ArsR family transcriptional regulator